MSGALEAATRQLFDAIDRKDVSTIIQLAAQDVQGVDEISRQWQRGVDAMSSYLGQAVKMVDDIQSTIDDIHETEEGETGFVTCWLEQDYTLEGVRTHVSAPTTVAFRRESEGWRIVLIHTVPMPPQET